MKCAIIFLIMGLSAWCNAKPIYIDLSDLRPYSEELNKQEPFAGEAPYISTFTKSKFKLSYYEKVKSLRDTDCVHFKAV